jgi:DNA polymerase-3 subunit gamma/tau
MSNDHLADQDITADAEQQDDRQQGEYVVVARRYRPKSFEELVGQGQVSQALSNAINTNRVGHAYLFTGARGVGKTSTARILAKALNCVMGPTPAPCNECDVCQAVASGEDMDVLEIDGASNRGIDEIRQLRSNVNVRPSRARFKIYIIDEVHMLTTPAFNALLKTLEEPPEHVKFIFCTTDPEKIPITVLSRCQRFDFAPVETDAIIERLRHIVQSEKVEADDEALHILARRAGGSMRDSQSLLEQLLSFCGGKITADDVHSMLGTAHSGRLASLASQLIARDAAAALRELDETVGEGVDVGQLTEQLLGYFRDMMAAVVGCPADMLLHCAPADFEPLRESGQSLGLETILAIAQILDQTIMRLRQSTQVRTLVEMSLVRICHLEDLDQLATLVADLREGVSSAAAPVRRAPPAPAARSSQPASPAAPAASTARPAASSSPPAAAPPAVAPAQKKSEPPVAAAAVAPSEPAGHAELTSQSLDEVWKQVLNDLGDMTADFAGRCDRLAISGPNRLVVSFKAQYDKEACERPDRKERIEQALARLMGRHVRIDFEVSPGQQRPAENRPPVVSKRQRMRDKEKHPLVRKAIELFDAEIVDLDDSRMIDIAAEAEGTEDA